MIILITTSGIGSRLGKLTKYTNKALIKIGDKLAIDYIIKRYMSHLNVKFYVTLGYYATLVKQYLNLAYPNIKFIFINIDNYNGTGSSLVYTLLQCKSYINEPFIYTCCDALIDEQFELNLTENVIFVSKNKDSYRYSTVLVKSNHVFQFMDKGATIFDYIYIGVAYIKNFNSFFKYAGILYNNNKTNNQLSDMNVYQLMLGNNILFRYKIIDKYNDTGSVLTYNCANSYYKNNYEVLPKYKESISFINNRVIKYFFEKDRVRKLIKRSEMLKFLIPSIYNYSDNFLCMELIDSKPLSQIYIKGLIYKLLIWAQKKLWTPIKCDQNFKDVCMKFYKDKTEDRIKDCLTNKLCVDYEVINNCKVGNIYNILKKIDFNYLVNTNPTNFHGDFILDNILYKGNDNFILIDWRDSFGGDLKMGDLYYDLAKLRHNIFFNHKNINNNMFSIIELDKFSINLDMKCNYFLIEQLDDYDKFVAEQNLDMKKIKLLMGLIWLNMAPLHSYPLSNFLFNLGKYTLYNYYTSSKLVHSI